MEEKIKFGIGNYSDMYNIEEYQILSKDLFPIYKKEFINFYSKTNNLIILIDFKCKSSYLDLSDSFIISSFNYNLDVYNSNII